MVTAVDRSGLVASRAEEEDSAAEKKGGLLEFVVGARPWIGTMWLVAW